MALIIDALVIIDTDDAAAVGLGAQGDADAVAMPPGELAGLVEAHPGVGVGRVGRPAGERIDGRLGPPVIAPSQHRPPSDRACEARGESAPLAMSERVPGRAWAISNSRSSSFTSLPGASCHASTARRHSQRAYTAGRDVRDPIRIDCRELGGMAGKARQGVTRRDFRDHRDIPDQRGLSAEHLPPASPVVLALASSLDYDEIGVIIATRGETMPRAVLFVSWFGLALFTVVAPAAGNDGPAAGVGGSTSIARSGRS